MTEYFRSSSHVNGKWNSVNGHIVYMWYGITVYKLLSLRKDFGTEDGSLQTLVQLWEEDRKANTSDPEYCISLSYYEIIGNLGRVEGRSKLRKFSRMG